MTDLKQQSATIHEICAEIQQEISRLTYKPVTGSGWRKKKLAKRYTIIKDVNATICSLLMVGEKRIHALPKLITLIVTLLELGDAPTTSDTHVRYHNTKQEIKKLLESIK